MTVIRTNSKYSNRYENHKFQKYTFQFYHGRYLHYTYINRIINKGTLFNLSIYLKIYIQNCILHSELITKV